MPQIIRAAQILAEHHCLITQKRSLRGRKNTEQMMNAYGGVKTSWNSRNSSERNRLIGARPVSYSSASSAVTANAIAGRVEPRDRLEAAGDRAPFVRRLDEVLAVVVDHAVAIEDDQLQRTVGLGIGGELDHVCPSALTGKLRNVGHPVHQAAETVQ